MVVFHDFLCPKLLGPFWGTKWRFFGLAVAWAIAIASSLGQVYYCTPWWDLSNNLSSDQNRDHMQKLCPWEVGISTYHFGAHKTIGVSSSRVLFRVFLPSILYVKKAFVLFVILTWKMPVAVTSLLREKLPPFKWVLLFYNFYSFCNFYFNNRKQVLYLYVSSIFLCVLFRPHINLDQGKPQGVCRCF